MCSERVSVVHLASASPRRRELLEQIGVPVQRVQCSVDERPCPDEAPADYVQRVTRDKVRAGVAIAPAGAVVLAADTAVVLNDAILGKPVDQQHAQAMLRSLSGRQHQVLTAVAVACGSDIRLQLVATKVRFRPLSDAEILAYWQTGEPADKAGAYGIPGLGAVFVEHIEGSYSAVVGLPLAETALLLAEFAVPCWQLR
ncbi:septum formation protein [Halopseudomonas litoralis]|uniref:Nucleoside triphosphate pyrophosphatase n=1 Tax=Halopseudomonas litoralis TaxID=797277 RepID=A0A1H1LAC0_9GAMM|nr:Maf family protein [Halopseudomonas litoralis]SDR71534.1 septum formation protein [Halopseudomonas litoralis]